MSGAYYINGQAVPDERFYEAACDPRRSVVVEACAGAGKTWMLVSRILRALLDGLAPSQILAITFTRKAAGEMRERLHGWLREFAALDEPGRVAQLRLRGMNEASARQAAPRLADLYRQWLEDGQGVEIHTIHGWFSRLLRAAPLDALAELQLPPQLNLVEDTTELWPALWGRFLRRIDARQEQPEGEAFVQMVREVGRFNLEGWLSTALANRLEIELADRAGRLEGSLVPAAQWSAAWSPFVHPLDALGQDAVEQGMWAAARALGQGKTKTQKAAGAAIEAALGQADLRQRQRQLWSALFTSEGSPRKQVGDAPEVAWAHAWLQDLREACEQQEAADQHRCLCILARALFQEYAALKAQRGQVDMVDLELAASHLLADSSVSGWIQERLDTQIRQLLMDEFQDTSPLQWQTLKAWLGGYAGAGGGASGQQGIRVFLVGDPKQSIYRFRRADPRVFEAAKQFIIEGLDGLLLACDHTRRNAPGVIDALNKVMTQALREGAFQAFRPHTTASRDPARVAVLPDVAREAQAQGQAAGTQRGRDNGLVWRDTLHEARTAPETSLKQAEAGHVASAIHALIHDQGCAPEDIFVLSRKRATLLWVAQALTAHGIPHVAPEDTPLIDTAEARDLVALVEALISPHHDLALAHALRSPVFGWTDALLMDLAARAKPEGLRWWDALMAWPQPPQDVARAIGLLTRWRRLAAVTPPHDLLETIVHEGDLRARLAAAVPVAERSQALAHVDALLAQSLAMDGGRDATPYRWVRALKRLPLTVPPVAHPGAVQLLTIHGAKGLEARAVFIVDADAQESRSNSHTVMIDWPESETRPLRCAFLRSEANPPPSLAGAVEQERAEQRREELNALYVALTRAREQLIFSRTEPRASNRHGSWWQRLWDAGAVGEGDLWDPQRSTDETAPGRAAGQALATPVRLAVLPSLAAQQWQEDAPAACGTGGPGQEDGEAALLGRVVHQALEWLTALPAGERDARRVEAAIAAALKSQMAPAGLRTRAAGIVGRLLGSAELAPWLNPQGLAWAANEVALSHKGRSMRIDRLVAIDGAQGRQWWVLDYKLSYRPEELPAYHAQLRQYAEAVAALQPGDQVRAALVTGDGRLVEIAS